MYLKLIKEDGKLNFFESKISFQRIFDGIQKLGIYISYTQFSITTTQNLLFYTKSDREE